MSGREKRDFGFRISDFGWRCKRALHWLRPRNHPTSDIRHPKSFSLLAEAAQALRFNRQRSILTVISLAWGVACFVILYSYGEGFNLTLVKSFKAVGQDLILMIPGQTSSQAGGE